METRPNRREWILKSSPTISMIFQEYPRLLDYGGDIVKKYFLITLIKIYVIGF